MKKTISSVSIFLLVLLFINCSGSDPAPEKITESVIIDKVAKSSGITRSQAQIGLSALMKLSEEKLSPEEFTTLNKDFPGGDNLYKFASDLGFNNGTIKTQADIVQILVNLGVNPVDAGKFLSSVLSVSKNLEGGVSELISKVYER